MRKPGRTWVRSYTRQDESDQLPQDLLKAAPVKTVQGSYQCVGRSRLLPAARRGSVVLLSCGDSQFAGRNESPSRRTCSLLPRRRRQVGLILRGCVGRVEVVCQLLESVGDLYPVYRHDDDQVPSISYSTR